MIDDRLLDAKRNGRHCLSVHMTNDDNGHMEISFISSHQMPISRSLRDNVAALGPPFISLKDGIVARATFSGKEDNWRSRFRIERALHAAGEQHASISCRSFHK